MDEGNRRQRMEAVERWANFIKDSNDEEWSKMQAELIDSQIESAQDIALTKKQVDYIKKGKLQ